MELQMQRHAWVWRAPDWKAAVAAGFAASALLMVLELAWSASLGDAGPWETLRKVAALVMGRGVLETAGFSLAVVVAALLVHYALGVFSGIAVGMLISGFNWEQSPGVMQAIGAAFGALIYLVNFHLLSQVFPWVTDLRGWATFVGHLAFGMAASFLYWKLGRPPS
ncbi:MAG: hypothetical protein ABI564_10285 [Ideonella sp.]